MLTVSMVLRGTRVLMIWHVSFGLCLLDYPSMWRDVGWAMGPETASRHPFLVFSWARIWCGVGTCDGVHVWVTIGVSGC